MFCCLVTSASASLPTGALEALARACSPRVELHGDRAVVFDASGLSRVIGPPDEIAREVSRLAALQRVPAQLALASTMTTAWLMAHARAGASVVQPGAEAQALAPLPLSALRVLEDLRGESGLGDAGAGRRRRRANGHHYRLAPGPGARSGEAAVLLDGLLATFDRWGLRTLGDVAALPRADVHARMGPLGVRLHAACCGEDATRLVPAGEVVRFIEHLDLEWPIAGLEPLAFVLARHCDRLSDALERADRGAVTVTTRLRLVTRETFERVLNLPAPMRDPRVLRTLILLDLESHSPTAEIDAVTLELGVVPGRIVLGSLFASPLPTAEDLSTLLARLQALAGETRVGAPVLVDTYDARAVSMAPFTVSPSHTATLPVANEGLVSWESERGSYLPSGNQGTTPSLPCLRRFRLPLAARVSVEGGVPVHLAASARDLSGRIVMHAGPWRSSGQWWTLGQSNWDRDEWDVQLADGRLYRIARDRATSQWVVEGALD